MDNFYPVSVVLKGGDYGFFRNGLAVEREFELCDVTGFVAYALRRLDLHELGSVACFLMATNFLPLKILFVVYVASSRPSPLSLYL